MVRDLRIEREAVEEEEQEEGRGRERGRAEDMLKGRRRFVSMMLLLEKRGTRSERKVSTRRIQFGATGRMYREPRKDEILPQGAER